VTLKKDGTYKLASDDEQDILDEPLPIYYIPTTREVQNTQTPLSVKSNISTVPGSLYSTPRENPLNNLEKIDLTLNLKTKNFDLKSCLVDIITECECGLFFIFPFVLKFNFFYYNFFSQDRK
jgi:hypothetical protein